MRECAPGAGRSIKLRHPIGGNRRRRARATRIHCCELATNEQTAAVCRQRPNYVINPIAISLRERDPGIGHRVELRHANGGDLRRGACASLIRRPVVAADKEAVATHRQRMNYVTNPVAISLRERAPGIGRRVELRHAVGDDRRRAARAARIRGPKAAANEETVAHHGQRLNHRTNAIAVSLRECAPRIGGSVEPRHAVGGDRRRGTRAAQIRRREVAAGEEAAANNCQRPDRGVHAIAVALGESAPSVGCRVELCHPVRRHWIYVADDSEVSADEQVVATHHQCLNRVVHAIASPAAGERTPGVGRSVEPG